MQGSFQVAQATGTGNSTNSAPVRIYKLTKPLTDQAVVVNLGYDQKVKVDFSSIANEKITLVHVGEKLIILFDNQSTVTVEPFFDSRADGLKNVTIEMAPGREVSVQEFATLFPISTDASVLPAADNGGNSNGNAQASGANFSPFAIDPLAPVPTNVLAPQEELPNLVTPVPPTGFVLGIAPPPTISGNALSALIVDESFLTAATNHGVAGSGLGPAGATVASVQVSFNVTVPGGQQSLTYALSVTTPNEDSGLIDSATGQHVLLTVNAAGVVEGRTAISGDLVLTVSVDAAGHVTLTDLRAVHEATPGNFNEGITLASGLITLTATVTDNNNQSASASVDVGSHLTILDDGPVAGTVTGATDTLVLDETRPVGSDTAGGTTPTGLASVTADFSNNFTGGSYGADGAGSTAYTLHLTGTNVASGLYALDPTDTNPAHFGQGAQIVLNQSGDTITGSANGTTYFTITINETTGIVTFTQVNNIWHADPTNPDDAATLTLSSASLLQVVQTITDVDGDSVATPINLGGGVFTIQDSGPTAGTVIEKEGPAETLVLDESRPVGSDTPGGFAPSGLASVTADFSHDFTSGSYGSDGPGHTAYTLKLTGSNVASGLYALDPTDTTTADGDGIGQGAQIVLNQSGNTITGSAGGTTYFTITIDPSTGIVTFTQSNNIWHSDPKNPDDPATLTLSSPSLLQVVQTITDADGDSVSTPLDVGTRVFTIQDSGPTAGTVTGATDTLVLDETRPAGSDTAGGTAPTGLDSVTADFSNNFTPGSYGSDGPGHTTYTLNLAGANVASGLYALDATDTTTADGDGIGQGAQILLNQVGNTITGSAGGTNYFTITIDPSTGIVTFTQLNNIWHSDPTNPDDAATLTLSGANLLQVVQTIVDADGDSVTTPLDVGTGVFTIQDSGPSAGTVIAAADTLVLDETRPVGTDTAGGATPTGLDTVTADFSNNFSAGSYGSDGAGNTAYTLKLTGVNVASGLYALDPTDTDPTHFGQGAQIVLNQSGDTITGSVGGTTYFTITIDETTGIVTFTQLNNIWHADSTNPDDAATLTLSGANLLEVVQTITDADGDSVSTPLDVGTGVFTIQDSGPTAGTVTGPTDTLVLDETRPVGSDTAGGTAPTGLDTVTADFSNNFTGGNYGSDGAGNTAYTLKLTGANVASGLYALDPTDTDPTHFGQGAQILLNQVGDTITGSAGGTNYFTITIDETTGIVTFTQLNNIWHSDPTNPDDSATLTLSAANLLQVVQTITDADGDHVSTPLDVGTGVFTIQDSGPTASALSGATDTLVLDETRPAGTDTAGGTAPTGLASVTADFSNGFAGGSYGSDGPGNSAYTLKLTGANVASGLYALDPTDTDPTHFGQGAQILLNQVGNTITGSVGGTDYFTIAIDPSTGIVTFTQLNNIWHSDPTNPDDAATLTLSRPEILQLVQTITDADGDSVTTSLNLGSGVFTIQDSGPTAGTVTGPTDTLVLDETRPVGTDTAGGTAPTGLDTVTADFSNNFSAGSYGSDGPGNTAYTLKLTGVNVASGLYALDPTDTDPTHFGQGAQIVLNQVGDTITGSANGTTYFTITINETTGIVTFTQLNNIWHSDPTNPDDAATLTLSAANLLQVVQTITDADGDSVSTPLDVGTGVFTIQDSGPTAGTVTGPTDTLVLDETRPVGSDTAGGTAPTGLDTVTADFSNNFTGGNYGSDGAGNTAYTLKLTGVNVASGLYALDPTDTDPTHFGQGTQIVLNQVGDTITGSANGTTYFTITINETTGIVTFTQVNNIWHSDPTNPDDSATLTLSAANLLQVVQTITDADGDSVTTPLDVGTGVFTIQDSGPTAGTVTGPTDTLVLDETRPTGTDTAGGTAPTGLDTVTADFSNNFTAGSYGSDGAGSTTYTLKLTGANVASGLYALDPTDTDPTHFGQGTQIVLNQVGDTITGSANGTTYFTITINETTGIVTFTQVNNIWHSDPTNPDDAATLTLSAANLLQVVQTITDADGDSVTTPINVGTGVFTIQDSGPTAGTVTGPTDTLVLDETRPVGSDTAGGTAPTGLDTVTADFSNNFTAGSYGSDGAGSTTYTLKLMGLNVASGLYALDPTDKTAGDGDGIGQGTQIVLNQVGDTITGSANGTTYFTITINETTGIVTFTQVNNIWHSDPNNPDDAATLTLTRPELLQVVQTITDADGDSVTTPLNLGTGVFTIQDSGPTAGTVTGPTDTLVLDETRPVGSDTAGGTAPTGLDTVTADFSNNFTGGGYGSDGAGSTTYTLKLTGANVASGLYALDPTDKTAGDGDGIGQGAQILLNQVGNTITGSVGGTNYFTITIDPSTGIVTFAQLNNIWHSDPTNPDDAATLTLSAANLLQVVQTITDADGDSVSTSLNLGTGVFTIQDSGPTAGTVTGPTDTLVLDETRPVGTDTAGGTAPNGVVSVTANFSDNFTGGSYGSDGAGSTTYTLKLTGSNVASGLYALDATDKTAGDGDGIGQGAQIVLNQSGNTITGSANGTTYFTIAIDPATGIVTFTQVNNIWHSDPNNPDDAATLTLSSANLLQVVQTIVDADGDSVSTPLDLGTGVFTIQDSGPTAPTATVSAATIGVDETPGVQTTGGASDVLGSTAITFNGAASTVAALFSTVANKGVDTDVSAASLDNGALSFASTGASSILTVAGGSFGSDGAGSTTYALSVLSAASGLTLTDGTGIELSLDASGRIIGTVGNDAANPSLTGQTAFAIAIDPITGQLYVADYLSLHHNSTASPNDLLTMTAGKIGATVTLTDADGDHVTATADISTHISFLDDGPSFGTIEHGIIADYAGMSVLGNLPVFSGADGFGAYDFTLTGNTAPAGLTFNGQAVHYSIDAFGQNLTAYIGAAPSAANSIFTLTLDDTTGHYLFTLLQPFTETTIQDVGSSSAFGSGPSQEQMLSSSTDQLAVISGTASGGAQGSVNGSTNGWGVGNNNFDPNEKLLFDFTDGASASPAGNAGFHPPAHESVANYTFSGYKAGDDIHYVVSYWDGVHAASITSVSGDFDPSTHTTVATEWSTPTAPAGLQLYTVQFTDVTGSGKVDLVGVGVSSTTNVSEDLSFNVSTIDGDGDTASSTISININGTATLLGTAGNDVIVAGPTNETLTGNGGDDKFVLNLSAHDIISDFNSGDTLLLDVAGLSLPTGVSNALTAGQFTSSAVTGGTENNASAWNESASTNKFFFNNTTHELWYSANGTGSDKVDLAHVSTGLPAATNVHIF
ncbi:VanZ family protein [Bradyrhizobium elkanii]|nr:VanZ family protein [Bradyrhizobium elkanii]